MENKKKSRELSLEELYNRAYDDGIDLIEENYYDTKNCSCDYVMSFKEFKKWALKGNLKEWELEDLEESYKVGLENCQVFEYIEGD